MKQGYHPRKEVLEIFEENDEKDILDEGEAILCIGRKEYRNADILKEIKKGTPLGKKMYRALEIAYDASERFHRGDPINVDGLLAKIVEAMKFK